MILSIFIELLHSETNLGACIVETMCFLEVFNSFFIIKKRKTLFWEISEMLLSITADWRGFSLHVVDQRPPLQLYARFDWLYQNKISIYIEEYLKHSVELMHN